MIKKKTGVIAEIKRAVDWKEFKNLWEANANQNEFFELYKKTKAKLGEEANYKTFSEGWQYRTVLNENYRKAREEFLNLVFGWW